MYAIIASGGKQYRVSPGDVIRVEKIDAEVDKNVTFDKVLLVSGEGRLDIGEPYVQQTTVQGKVIQHGRGGKVDIIKFIRRKRHTRKAGHRQSFTEVEITDISP